MTDFDLDIDVEWKRGRSPAAFASKMVLFKKRLNSELEQAMQESVLWVERDAKQFAPVDTGTLRASIASMVEGTVKDEIRGYIGSNVSYALFQEMGTSKMDANPFIMPAVEKNRERILQRFRTAVQDAADGLF